MNTKKKLEIVKISPARVPDPKPKRATPTTLLDPAFKWTPPGTDIRERFKSLGWKPPKPQRPKYGK